MRVSTYPFVTTAQLTSGSSLIWKCPPTTDAGWFEGELLSFETNEILDVFALGYVWPLSVIAPTVVLLEGGDIRMKVWGELEAGCVPLFGKQRVPALSMSVLTDPSGTAHEINATVPPAVSPGTVQVVLSCRELGTVEGYLTYKRRPAVTSIQAQKPCTALVECAFLVTVSDPPQTIASLEDMTVSLEGDAEFVGRPGTTDVKVWQDIVTLATDVMVLRIRTPPMISGGLVRGGVCLSVCLSSCLSDFLCKACLWLCVHAWCPKGCLRVCVPARLRVLNVCACVCVCVCVCVYL